MGALNPFFLKDPIDIGSLNMVAKDGCAARSARQQAVARSAPRPKTYSHT